MRMRDIAGENECSLLVHLREGRGSESELMQVKTRATLYQSTSLSLPGGQVKVLTFRRSCNGSRKKERKRCEKKQ